MHKPAPSHPSTPPPNGNARGALGRRLLWKLEADLAALPASLVVQLALWPEKLADWARSQDYSPAIVYNCLAGHKPYEPVRDLLAQRLGVPRPEIDQLIDSPRSQPPTRALPRTPPTPPATSRSPKRGAQTHLPL